MCLDLILATSTQRSSLKATTCVLYATQLTTYLNQQTSCRENTQPDYSTQTHIHCHVTLKRPKAAAERHKRAVGSQLNRLKDRLGVPELGVGPGCYTSWLLLRQCGEPKLHSGALITKTQHVLPCCVLGCPSAPPLRWQGEAGDRLAAWVVKCCSNSGNMQRDSWLAVAQKLKHCGGNKNNIRFGFSFSPAQLGDLLGCWAALAVALAVLLYNGWHPDLCHMACHSFTKVNVWGKR